MIRFEIKKFEEFTIHELYAVMNLRSEVFVVEQNSIYLDLDYKDQKAIHVLGYVGEKLVAHSRLFQPGDYFELASIGRVVVAKDYRKFGYGHQLIGYSIGAVKEYFKETKIHISAQLYLKKFYESHGFVAKGEQYLEDNIPHIGMDKLS